jgi:hypothetical protein
MPTFSDQLASFLSGRNPKRCSPEEMAFLKSQAQANLPDSYLEFMEAAGNGVSDFLTGSDVFFKDLAGMREAADEL